MEARAGIEPALKDLQSSASPLGHRATRGTYYSAEAPQVPWARGKIQHFITVKDWSF